MRTMQGYKEFFSTITSNLDLNNIAVECPTNVSLADLNVENSFDLQLEKFLRFVAVGMC